MNFCKMEREFGNKSASIDEKVSDNFRKCFRHVPTPHSETSSGQDPMSLTAEQVSANSIQNAKRITANLIK